MLVGSAVRRSCGIQQMNITRFTQHDNTVIVIVIVLIV